MSCRQCGASCFGPICGVCKGEPGALRQALDRQTQIADAHVAANKELGKMVKGWKEFGEQVTRAEEAEAEAKRLKEENGHLRRALGQEFSELVDMRLRAEHALERCAEDANAICDEAASGRSPSNVLEQISGWANEIIDRVDALKK